MNKLWLVAAVGSILLFSVLGVAAIGGAAVVMSGCCGVTAKGVFDSLNQIGGQQAAALPAAKEKAAYQRVGPCKLELEKCSYNEDCCAGLTCMDVCIDPVISEQSKAQAEHYQASIYARVNPAKKTSTLNNASTSQTNQTNASQNAINQSQAPANTQANSPAQPSQPPAQNATPPQAPAQPQAPKKVTITLFKDNGGRTQPQSCIKNNLSGCTQASPDGMFAKEYQAVGTVRTGDTVEYTVETDDATEYNFGFNYIADAASMKNLVFQEAYSGWTQSKTFSISITSGVGDGKYSIGTDTSGMKVGNKRLIAFVRVRNADGKNELGTSSVRGMELGDDVTAIVYNIQ